MDSGLLLTGAGLVVGSFVLVFFVVFRPRYGSLPADRRRLGTQPNQSTISKISQSAADAMAGVVGETKGPFNRNVLYNAGIKSSPADFGVAIAGVALLVAALGTVFSHVLVGTLLAAATPLAAKAVLGVLTDRRRSKFEAQLTDTIQMIIGGLRVGHSVMRSVEATAADSEVPTSEELSRVVNETRIGKDPQVAIDEAADRMQSEDFRWIGQAIQINREVGGDLAGVLEQVASTIRERTEIKGQIRSLSAEGKMSAYVLAALPVGVVVVLGFVNPGYLNTFVEHPLGVAMFISALLMFAVGGFWMSRIVKIKF